MKLFRLGDRVRYGGYKTEYQIAWVYGDGKVDLRLAKSDPLKECVYEIGHIFSGVSCFNLELIPQKHQGHPLTKIFKD